MQLRFDSIQPETGTLFREYRMKFSQMIPPPSALGGRAANAAHRLSAFMRSLHLVSGDFRVLRLLLVNLVSIATDLGVESLLTKLEPFSLSQILPFFDPHSKEEAETTDVQDCLQFEAFMSDKFLPLLVSPTPLQPPSVLTCWQDVGFREVHDDDWEEAGVAPEVVAQEVEQQGGDGVEADQAQAQDVDTVCLRASFGVGGLLHVIHNASMGLGSCVQRYDAEVDNMAELAKFLRERHSKERLISKCFSSGNTAAPPIRRLIEAFASQCYKERWGAVAKCALDLRKVLPALRLGWDKVAYLTGTAHGRGSNAAESAKSVDCVDKLVHSTWFDAYLLMLQSFSALIMRLLAWAESCPCHWHILSGPASETLLEECPMRTRRAPELALNDFMEELTSFSQQSATRLAQELPSDLSDADRAQVLREFEMGRSYLTMVLTLKTSHFRNLPWSAAGLAHPDGECARDVWRAIRSARNGPEEAQSLLRSRLPRLLDPDVLMQGDQWFDGSDMALCPKFAEVVASLSLIPIAERRVEGQHAKTQKGSKKSPHHSPAFMSLQLRGLELRSHMTSQPRDFVSALAPLVYECRTYKKAAESMNLVKHPRLAESFQGKRDKLLRNALYRADLASQRHTLPEVFAQDPRSRGPKALPPAEVLDNSSLRGVLQQIALEHVCNQVQELRKADGADPVFAVRYETSSFALLREFLLPGRAHVQTDLALQDIASEALVASSNMPASEADVLFQKLWLPERTGGEVRMVFFKLLPNIRQMKRFQAEGERSSRSSDLPVALMRPVFVDPANKECLLDFELLSVRSLPAGLPVDDVPCVMSVANMSLEQLRSLVILKTHDGVVCCLRNNPALPDVPDKEHTLRSVLKQVCERGKGGLPDLSSFSAAERAVLQSLQDQGAVSSLCLGLRFQSHSLCLQRLIFTPLISQDGSCSSHFSQMIGKFVCAM